MIEEELRKYKINMLRCIKNIYFGLMIGGGSIATLGSIGMYKSDKLNSFQGYLIIGALIGVSIGSYFGRKAISKDILELEKKLEE